jgi:hypothetical protein
MPQNLLTPIAFLDDAPQDRRVRRQVDGIQVLGEGAEAVQVAGLYGPEEDHAEA